MLIIDKCELDNININTYIYIYIEREMWHGFFDKIWNARCISQTRNRVLPAEGEF